LVSVSKESVQLRLSGYQLELKIPRQFYDEQVIFRNHNESDQSECNNLKAVGVKKQLFNFHNTN